MNVHTNLTAYEGVESIERFSPATFQRYCDDKLASCEKYLAFIRRNLPRKPLRVLEIGSGSGKLLFRLEREGMLERGLGFEVSQSRCRFAAEFGKYCKSTRVQIANADFVEFPAAGEGFDLVIGIDVVANLICAISPSHTDRLLTRVGESLDPGGLGALELMTCKRELAFVRHAAENVFRTWKQFEESDPFRFGLDELWCDDAENLVWDKRFIARTGEISGFRNVLKPFTEREFQRYVERQGFSCEIEKTWANDDDTADQEFIAVIRK